MSCAIATRRATSPRTSASVSRGSGACATRCGRSTGRTRRPTREGRSRHPFRYLRPPAGPTSRPPRAPREAAAWRAGRRAGCLQCRGGHGRYDGFFQPRYDREVGPMIVLVMLISVLSLGFAVFLARQVLAADTGTPQMQDIASAIKEGAEAFLRRQYRTIAVIGLGVAVLIFVLYAAVRPHNPNDPTSTLNMAIATTLSFVFGPLCSGIAGYIGMFVSIRANLRPASAVRTSLNRALQIALRGGAVSGLFVVAMSLLGVGGLFAAMRAFGVADEKIPLLIVGYGFGASLVALFAQLRGGDFTKAADVGADLVGKVEAGIPEDDPRNPAVIADLVGDNVGDCAGRGADLFESTAAENIGAM